MQPNANPSLPQIGQRLVQDGLQTFLYNLSGMHTLNLKIDGDMEFKVG
jgi:hypothetical protein